MKQARPQVQWPPLYEKQHAAFFGAGPKHRAIEGSTKSGKTAAAILWIVFKALELGGAHAWFSPVKSQARDAFYRTVDCLPTSKIDDHETFRRIRIPSRPAAIYFLSSDSPDNLFGEGYYSLIVDEASRVKGASWSAIRTMALSTKAPIRALGNVRDRQNWHYQQCRKAEAGRASAWAYHELHWSDAVAADFVPVEREDVEELREDLDDDAARALLENEAQADASNPFGGYELLEEIAIPGPVPDDPVAYGVDLARVQDWTVLVGLGPKGRVAQFERFQAPWGETVRRICAELDAPACVDQTGVGDGVVPRIQRGASARVEGIKMSDARKRDLYEELATAVQQGETQPTDGMVAELAGVQAHMTRKGYLYSSGEDHDDIPDAYALALRAHRNRRIIRETQDRTGGETQDVANFEDKGW